MELKTVDSQIRALAPEKMQEHDGLEEAFKRLGDTERIVNIQDVINSAGGVWVEEGKIYAPALALARYGWKQSNWTTDKQNFYNRGRSKNIIQLTTQIHNTLQEGGRWTIDTWNTANEVMVADEVKSLVPAVPSSLKPQEGDIVLFEPTWTVEAPKTLPVDPALLRPIKGMLYEVIGVWEMTELEEAVLATEL